MATTEAVADGEQTWEDITWVQIGPDGSESQAFGRIWGQAPPLAGMSAWWVIEDAPDGEPGSGAAVLVVRASRRHLVGREVDGRWRAAGGRYVDAGECFQEIDPRSRFSRTFTPPTHAVPRKPPNRLAMDAYVALLATYEASA